MTAEIAVMNRQGVALAADSAVTLQGTKGPKIFSSADKIFALSKYEPVAAMVYGGADINDVPWETAIKLYREALGRRRFGTVREYADHFMAYLERHRGLFTEPQQRHFALREALALCTLIGEAMETAVEDAIEEQGPLSRKERRRIALREISRQHAVYSQGRDRPGLPRGFVDRVVAEYAPEIARAKRLVFDRFGLPSGASRKISEMFGLAFAKDGAGGYTGLVVAGFGADEIFPRLVEFGIDGVLIDHLAYWYRGSEAIEPPHSHAYVQGFAQSDMIRLFMEGVTPEYERFVESYMARAVAQLGDAVQQALVSRRAREEVRAAQSKFLSRFRRSFADKRRELYISPVLDVVASLPKDELGQMAESLVTLTSLKRRISMEHETVGGPVDVAIITKGDGLVWARRKQYFDPRLNHHFFANYF
jgi:hypothetical protein